MSGGAIVLSIILAMVFSLAPIVGFPIVYDNWNKRTEEENYRLLYMTQICWVIGIFIAWAIIIPAAAPAHGITMALWYKRTAIYFGIGIVATIVNWWLRGREHIRKVNEGEITAREAVNEMDPEKQFLYILSTVFVWPYRLIHRFVGFVRRMIMIVRTHPLNTDWVKRLNPLLFIFRKVGLSEAEKVSMKLKE